MLDYKDILTKRYVLRLSLREIAEQTGAGKSGVHDFLKAFEKCDELNFPLPPGITNAGIAIPVSGAILDARTAAAAPVSRKVSEVFVNK
jgi:hypothetical protein